MKVLKVCFMVVVVIALLGIAGTSDYTETVIYNMPQNVYDGIVADNPELTQKEIADYYIKNQKELLSYYNSVEK